MPYRANPENCIRTLTHTLSRQFGSKPVQKIQRHVLRRTGKKSRKRVIRLGLFTANLALLAVVVGFVLYSPSSGGTARQSSLAGSNTSAANPLDQLSSSDIAVHAARLASLPEATAVINQADTISGQMAIGSADTNVVAKPQILSTTAKSHRDIQRYVTQTGDTLASLSSKFGVTSDSIRWSNNLTGTTVPPGRELFIPPVNGIIHVVRAGDTADKLAGEYAASRDGILAFNDAEVGGLVVGQRIVIPDGSKSTVVYGLSNRSYGGGSFAWGTTEVYNGNGYIPGWCTFWAAKRAAELGMPIPSNWGNANTWDNYAARGGWTVSTTPRRGAIAQTDIGAGGLGHVGVVEDVSSDGTMIIYSDMNGLCGWGCSRRSGWVPTRSNFQRFIYR